MRFAFRWYGPSDPVDIRYIRQIPCITDIVTACYEIPSGELLPVDALVERKKQVEAAGLQWQVVEGLPVHEAIKLGTAERDHYLEIYRENIRRLAHVGIRVICYNFMPMFGWLRTDTVWPLPDGSTTLAFEEEKLAGLDPLKDSFKLPGWHFSTSIQERKQLLDAYHTLGTEGLRENLRVFLEAVIPTAEACGVRMAIHPDDPPVSVFGLPRVVSTADDLRRLRAMAPSPSNGITLCVGSFASAGTHENAAALAAEFAPFIPFVHARNIKSLGGNSFCESGHMTGDIDMIALLKALRDNGFDGWLRADHGRMIFGETGNPGYGLYDRALGVSYLYGIWSALHHSF